MKPKIRYALLFIFCLLASGLSAQTGNKEEPGDFVPIKAYIGEWQGKPINVSEFEILDHPVTNKEYKAFIDATKYPAPLYWKNGKIPEGKNDFPVIYVNRNDVAAYIKWLTETTGRIHRLPTSLEFEIAARGGKNSGDQYFWGNDEGNISSEKVNCNLSGDRKYDQWETYLKPAKWGLKNDLGLYQMAGNVWQLVVQNHDQATTRFKFRMEEPQDIENAIMGGGWASAKDYLVCGQISGQSPGLRCPDLGFRLVREPKGANWAMKNRRVVAVTNSPGKITISWASLKNDIKTIRFNLYRLEGDYRLHNGFKVNETPLQNTSFVDEKDIKDGTRYQYRVVEVDDKGNEGNPSDWAAITAGDEQYPIAAKFAPIFEKGDMVPVFGNLEGNGKLSCVIRLDNGCREMSQDPGLPVQLEAFSYTGRSLWRKNIAWHNNIYGNANNAPFNVWDMDGDGKDEVITLLQIGEENYIAILDGMSGKLKHKILWDQMATDHAKSSTRIQMSIACLDGKSPSVITQTGLYENEIISAYDNQLNKQWTHKSFMATTGSGGHKIEIADVDNDGKQEIIYGTTCLNADGTFRWSIYRKHPDIISIHDYIPDRPGLEVCFIVETTEHAGIYMVDANNGEVIWKNNRQDDPVWSHGHTGWTADIWDGSPGMECMTNRAGHYDKTYLLFSSDGKCIDEKFPIGFYPIEWDGDPTRELLGENGKVIGNFDGEKIVITPNETPNPIPNSTFLFSADLCGDFRSEIVVSATEKDGKKAVIVLTAPKQIEKKYVTPLEEMEYKLWLARNKGGGYGSVYDYEYK